MAGCREPEGSVSDKEGVCTCVDVSVYMGAGCSYLPKQILSEPLLAQTEPGRVSLSQSSLSRYCDDSRKICCFQHLLRPWSSFSQPGHLSSFGVAVQLQVIFCFLRIRKERRKWRPMVTTPTLGASLPVVVA